MDSDDLKGAFGDWARLRSLKWSIDPHSGMPFSYKTNKESETYQITVDLGGDGVVTVALYSVEIWNKEDVKIEWKTDRVGLNQNLDHALAEIDRLGKLP